MKTIEEKIFYVTDFLDQARWNDLSMEAESKNYFKDGLSSSSKILAHWLIYITDRMTRVEKIWDVGFFIFSNIADEIENNKFNPNIIADLLRSDQESIFFKTQTQYHDINPEYNDSKSDKYLFVATEKSGNNERLNKYFEGNKRPYFISRFYPSDYYAILCTMYILLDFEFNLGKYILKIMKYCDNDNLISKIMFGLYLLTYFKNIKFTSNNVPNYTMLINTAILRKNEVKKIIENEGTFNAYFNNFIKKNEQFEQKRAWCALRDYLKGNMKEEFKELLSNLDVNQYKRLFFNGEIKKELLNQFELPGDVWNNNNIFRECVFNTNNLSSKGSLAKYLRELYEKKKPSIGYPEQFDITYDFVQKMCAYKPINCNICPYAKIRNEANYFHN